MSAKKMTATDRARTENRIAEHLGNWESSRKPKPKGGNRVAYDWAKKRIVRQEKAGHQKCFGIAGDAARENYDRIFHRNAK